jgi:hypothetical protein
VSAGKRLQSILDAVSLPEGEEARDVTVAGPQLWGNVEFHEK